MDRNHVALVLIAGLTTATAPAASANGAPRFRLSGSGSLTQEVPAQDNGRFAIKAALDQHAGQPARAPEALTSARFALSAVASSNSLVCYDDTIFRDGFDGTGL